MLRATAEELRVSVANFWRWVLQGMGEIDCLDKILRSKKKAALTVEGEAFDFMKFVRIVVSRGNRNRRFIINMDQTPVFFSMSSKQTYS